MSHLFLKVLHSSQEPFEFIDISSMDFNETTNDISVVIDRKARNEWFSSFPLKRHTPIGQPRVHNVNKSRIWKKLSNIFTYYFIRIHFETFCIGTVDKANSSIRVCYTNSSLKQIKQLMAITSFQKSITQTKQFFHFSILSKIKIYFLDLRKRTNRVLEKSKKLSIPLARN